MDPFDPRYQQYQKECRDIEHCIWAALPEGASYAALIAALSNILSRLALEWSHRSVKHWRKPPKDN